MVLASPHRGIAACSSLLAMSPHSVVIKDNNNAIAYTKMDVSGFHFHKRKVRVFALDLLVKSSRYRREERRIVQHSRACWFGPGAQYNNDEPFGGVDVEMLSKDPAGFKGSCVNWISRRHGPPEIPIVDRLAADAMGCASLLKPCIGNSTAAVDHAIGKYEEAKSTVNRGGSHSDQRRQSPWHPEIRSTRMHRVPSQAETRASWKDRCKRSCGSPLPRLLRQCSSRRSYSFRQNLPESPGKVFHLGEGWARLVTHLHVASFRQSELGSKAGKTKAEALSASAVNVCRACSTV